MSYLKSNMQGDLPTPHTNTDGRTDRTNEEPTCDTALVQSATRAGGAKHFIEAPRRFPIVRTGERAEIPWDVRRAVYRRDGWRCHYCGSTWTETQLELDHMLPWSAGGSDASHNLRTLCQRCNGDRSNYDDRDRHKRVLPVTWWCIDCHGYVDPEDWSHRRYIERPPQVRPAPPIIEPHDRLTFAYCATCDINSYTEVVL